MNWKSMLFLALAMFLPTNLQAEAPKTSTPAQMVIYQDPLKFTLSPGCDDSEKFSFRLFSTGAPVENLKIVIKEVKKAQGQNVSFLSSPSEAIEFNNASTVTSDGLEITVTIHKSKFFQPGDYQVILRFLGDKAQPLTQNLTIIQPAAIVNAEELKDRTFKLTRYFPGWAASGSYPVLLYESDQQSAIRKLNAACQEAVLWEKNGIQAPGTVSVTPENTACLAWNEKLHLELKFSGFQDSGTFKMNLLLISPSFVKPIPIPMKIEVSDFWFWPLLVIITGVLLGLLITYVAKKYKPRQENILRLTKLKGIVERLSARTNDTVKLGKLTSLGQQLRDAEEKNQAGDFAGATTLLNTAENDLRNFQKEDLNERIEKRKAVSALKIEIKQYQQDQHLKPVYRQELAALGLLPDLEAAETHLAREEVDQAQELFQKCQTRFDKFRKTMLEKELRDREGMIGSLDTASQTALSPLVETIKNNLSANQLDQAFDNLEELQKQMDKISGPLPLGARIFRAREIARVKEAEGEITVTNAPENRTSDSIIKFSLQGRLPDHDSVTWDFGDGYPTDTKTDDVKDNNEHTYHYSGTYTVQACLIKDQKEVKSIPGQVEILPGQTEMSVKEIEKTLRLTDWVIFGTAVILAGLTGMVFLYVGKPFGSLQDYLSAFLWGFGIDSSIKGFSAVYGKIIQ